MTDLWTSVAAYAALEAQLANASANRAKVLTDANLDGLALARLRAAWDVRFAQDRNIEEAYESAMEAPEQALVREPERPTSVVEETPRLFVPQAPSVEASRWAAHAPPATAPPDLRSVVPPGMQHFSSVRETQMASNLPPGPALPFAKIAGIRSPELALPVEEQPPPERILRPPAHLSGTALAVDLPRGVALPFARSVGTPSSALEQPVEKQPLPHVVRPPAHLSGTALMSDVPPHPATPFSRGLTPTPAPEKPGTPAELTVDQYALLRAHLAVNGEGDQAAWEQFGVTSAADKHAIQAGFAARFKQDPTMQARFVELVPRLIAQLRRQVAGQ
jgi:hypothetical protein